MEEYYAPPEGLEDVYEDVVSAEPGLVLRAVAEDLERAGCSRLGELEFECPGHAESRVRELVEIYGFGGWVERHGDKLRVKLDLVL